jgi:hypothetical protein
VSIALTLSIRRDWRGRRICWYIFNGCGHEGGTDGQRAEAKQQGSEEAEGEQAQDFGVRLQKIGHSERPQVAMSRKAPRD